MSFVPFSIDLETIISPEPMTRSQFQESQIEELANLFLQARDTIKPIIVRKISPISFEVLEGYLEYYAALKAEQIDEQFTSIQAYIVPPELEFTILEQYEFLQSLSAPAIADPSEQSLINLIERTIAKQISPLKSGLQDVNTKLDSNNTSSNNAIERTNDANLNLSSNPDQSFILAVVEKLSERVFEVEKILRDIKQFLIKPDKSQEVLDGFNNLSRDEIEVKIFNAGFKAKAKSFAQGIYDGRQSKPYNSVSDVKVSGIGKGTMEKIISKW